MFDDVQTESGNIDRKKLGQQVFADNDKLNCLNKIVHPELQFQAIQKLKSLTGNIIIVGALIHHLKLNSYCDYMISLEVSDEHIYERSPTINKDIHLQQEEQDQHYQSADWIIKNEGLVFETLMPELEILLI